MYQAATLGSTATAVSASTHRRVIDSGATDASDRTWGYDGTVREDTEWGSNETDGSGGITLTGYSGGALVRTGAGPGPLTVAVTGGRFRVRVDVQTLGAK